MNDKNWLKRLFVFFLVQLFPHLAFAITGKPFFNIFLTIEQFQPNRKIQVLRDYSELEFVSGGWQAESKSSFKRIWVPKLSVMVDVDSRGILQVGGYGKYIPPTMLGHAGVHPATGQYTTKKTIFNGLSVGFAGRLTLPKSVMGRASPFFTVKPYLDGYVGYNATTMITEYNNIQSSSLLASTSGLEIGGEFGMLFMFGKHVGLALGGGYFLERSGPWIVDGTSGPKYSFLKKGAKLPSDPNATSGEMNTSMSGAHGSASLVINFR